MKKVLSFIIIATLIVSCTVLAVGAVTDAAKTVVDVKKGDEVVYTLNLSDTPEKVVGCDFSVYYDDSIFKVKSVSDFTGNTDPEEWSAVINDQLPGEVLGNWSILSGVKFQQKKQIVSVTLEAIAAGSTHISYYVRYMYPDSMEEFTTYKFTCDLTLNKAAVYEDAEPELNVDTEQEHGDFINSVTGDSKDADVNMSVKAKQNNVSGGNNGGDANENTSSKISSSSKTDDSSSSAAQQIETTTDENGEIVYLVNGATSNNASPSQTKNTNFPWAIVIISAVIVIGAACVAIYFINKKKKSK